MAIDQNSLVCDLAEVYGIFDYKRVPPRLLATLAAGLGENSRIGQKVYGVYGTTTEILLAELIDSVNALAFALCGEEGVKPPESRRDLFFAVKPERKKAEPEKEIETFESGEKFKERWNELIGGGKDG